MFDERPGTPQNQQIVPADAEPRRGLGPGALMAAGCLWCAVGGALGIFASPLGALFVGFGASLLTNARGTEGFGTSAAVTLAAALAASLIGGSSPVGLLICMVSALSVGYFAGGGRLTPSVACLTVLVTAAAYLGADAVLARLAGSDIVTYMTESAHALLAQAEAQASASVALASELQLFERLYDVLWPSAYAIVGLADVACASYGARAALRRLGASGTIRPFREFDLPLWVGYCLLAGIVGLVVARSVGDAAQAVLVVSANVLLAARLALGVAGLAITLWLLDEHKANAVVKALALVFAVVLDVQFFVMAIVGLIDLWANFRHLSRGGSPAPQEP